MSNGADARLARFNHLHTESLRFRNLVWRIVPSAWAIYSALVLFSTDKNPYSKALLSPHFFVVFLIATALFTTAFYAFAEFRICHAEEQYSRLADELQLAELFRQPGGLWSMGWVLSLPAYLLAIWFPPVCLICSIVIKS
tara:strand:+ start:761 stop:1180 length:420 start_codon:yes stop_codon:yes gene_type:complete